MAWIDRKPTVLLVTHDVDEAQYLTDRIAVPGGSRPASVVARISVLFECPRDHADPAFSSIRTRILTALGFGHCHADQVATHPDHTSIELAPAV